MTSRHGLQAPGHVPKGLRYLDFITTPHFGTNLHLVLISDYSLQAEQVLGFGNWPLNPGHCLKLECLWCIPFPGESAEGREAVQANRRATQGLWASASLCTHGCVWAHVWTHMGSQEWLGGDLIKFPIEPSGNATLPLCHLPPWNGSEIQTAP